MKKDYYAILELQKSASEDDIRKAYRRLARKHHPDMNLGDASAADRFKEIAEAYETLSDPDRRAAYDGGGAKSEPVHTGSPTVARRTASDPFTEEMYNAMRGQAGDFFDVEARVKAKKEKSASRGPVDAGDIFASYFGSIGKKRTK